MKVIFEQQNEETIHIDDVNENDHILVAIVNEHKCIAVREKYEKGKVLLRVLNQSITSGNSCYESDSLKEIIISLEKHQRQFRVFKNKDWFKAMQWLNEN